MEYKFDDEGYLLPQMVRKYELAFAYNRHPYSFRREIENIIWVIPKKHYYTADEVSKIQAELGRLTISDFQNSKDRVERYLHTLRVLAKKRKFKQ